MFKFFFFQKKIDKENRFMKLNILLILIFILLK